MIGEAASGHVELDELFKNFEKEAFRLETHPFYKLPGEWEIYTAWQQLRPVDEYPWPQWLELVKTATEQGRLVRRVMASKAPPHSFFEFRMQQYRYNANAGEQLRVVFTDDLPVTGDFWLFDESVAVLLNFDSQGRPVNTHITADPTLVSDLIEVKEDLLDWAEPLAGYWQRYIGGVTGR